MKTLGSSWKLGEVSVTIENNTSPDNTLQEPRDAFKMENLGDQQTNKEK